MSVPTSRTEFTEYCLDNKYSKWYFRIIDSAIARGWNRKNTDIYLERHHYVPKSFGGSETVYLTAKEHFICHLLLPKMVQSKDKIKMSFALHRLINGNNKNYCKSSILYESIRKQNSEASSERSKRWWNSLTENERSIMRSGSKNSRYGIIIKGTETALKIGKANKGKLSGNNHPLWNKQHTEESKKKVSENRKGKCLGKDNPNFGKGAAKNKKWFNNGSIERYFDINQIPDGWNHGRLKRVK